MDARRNHKHLVIGRGKGIHVLLLSAALASSPLDLVLTPHQARQVGMSGLETYRLQAAEEQYRIAYSLAVRAQNSTIAAVAASNVGAVAFERSQLDSAETWFRLALQIDNRHEEALANLGSVYYRRAMAAGDSGDWPTANHLAFETLDYYEQALRMKPNRPTTLRNVAMVFIALGRPDRAALAQALADRLTAP